MWYAKSGYCSLLHTILPPHSEVYTKGTTKHLWLPHGTSSVSALPHSLLETLHGVKVLSYFAYVPPGGVFSP